MRISEEEYRALLERSKKWWDTGEKPPLPSKKKKSKLGNKRTEVDGHKFQSQLEARYYNRLKLLKLSGEVEKFELQPKYVLQPAFDKNGTHYRAVVYKADFKVTYKDGHVEIVDVKGFKTKVFRLKQKLFEYAFPQLTLKIVTKDDF